MRVTFAAQTTIAVLLIAPVGMFAKGDTVRITITGGDLGAPIDITDPVIVHQYNVWAGRGTSSGEPHSVNIDWTQGMAEPPKGVPVYEVSFVTTRSNPGTYVVRFVIDPATKRG
jgi:hypothetical protein